MAGGIGTQIGPNLWLGPNGIPTSNPNIAAQVQGPAPTPDPLSLNPAGMPKYPDFESALDPNTGNLKSQYQLTAQAPIQFNSNLGALNSQLSQINYDPSALNAYQNFALSSGTSPYAQTQLDANALNTRNLESQAAQQSAGQNASAFDQLASQGGLSSGARERLATQGMRNSNAGFQNAAMQGNQTAAGIQAQDAQNKLAALGQLPGMQVQSLQPALQKTSMWGELANSENQQNTALQQANRNYATGIQGANIAGALGQLQAKNNYNLGAYGNTMQNYAATQQANAMANSGGKK